LCIAYTFAEGGLGGGGVYTGKKESPVGWSGKGETAKKKAMPNREKTVGHHLNI